MKQQGASGTLDWRDTQDTVERNENGIFNLVLKDLLSQTPHLPLYYLLCTVGPGKWIPISQYLLMRAYIPLS